MKHSHYKKDVRHLSMVDVYRVLDLFGVTSPPIQHAIKKLLLPGGRGAKDLSKDLTEAIDSIQRALEMMVEDSYAGITYPQHAPKAEDIVTMQVRVKVDPTADLLVQAVKVLSDVEADERVENHLRIQARAMLRKVENADFRVVGSSEAAVAQGIDLVTTSRADAERTAQLSIERSRMPRFADRPCFVGAPADAVSAREIDSYSHQRATLVGGAGSALPGGAK